MNRLHRRSTPHAPRYAKTTPILTALILAGLAAPVAAVDRSWDGGNNGLWTDAGNWSPVGVPGSGDTAIFTTGSADLSVDAGISALQMSGGTVFGSGTLTLSGTSTLSGGIQSGAGTSQFSGDLLLNGDGNRQINGGRTVNTNATTTWGGNTAPNTNRIQMIGGATINNSGTWNDQNTFVSDLGLGNGTRTFNNSGTYNKTGDATTTVHSDYKNSGTTTIAAGTMAFNAAIDNTGGLIEGIGTLVTPRLGFDNAGTIAPGLGDVGALSVDGDLALDSTSVLAFELAGLTSFDEMFLTGDITVGGTLMIDSLGGYMPTVNDSFTIITFAQSIGDQRFDNVTWNGFSGGVVLDVLYNADNITLAVAAIPEPEQYLMMLAGLGLIGAVVRRRRAQI